MAKKKAKTSKKRTTRAAPGDSPKTRLETPAPLPLDRILGQKRALATIDNALRSGRVHHAWIFHGPSGVGKFTTALAFAGVLLDPTSAVGLTGRFAPDPDSPVQQMLARGAHPDLHVVVKELARFSADASVRSRKLASIPRGVIDEHLIGPATLRASVQPGGLASKVFIVDEAELMGGVVQNAVLKTLEEPPEGTVIILVTSSEERLLPTIRSRCQRVTFPPLDEEAMDRWLASSGLALEDRERDWLVRSSGGSPGRLLRAHEGGMYAWRQGVGPMLEELDRGGYPVTLASAMSSYVDEWAKGWVKQGDPLGENRSKDNANRIGARRMLSLVAEHYREQLTRDAERAAEAIERVAQAERTLGANVQVQFVMEELVAGLVWERG
ncbi:MAG: hypothetical protein ACIARR_09660 [Phycisphaerales bacterium JB059]